MKNLFLIDGASGTGKSDLVQWVDANNAGDVAIVKKATTRDRREAEHADPTLMLDLEFVSKEEFDSRQFDYTYKYAGLDYGFHARTLTEALLTKNNVFVIVRSTDLIRRLAEDYRLANVVPLFIYTDHSQLEERLRRSGSDVAAITFRQERSKIALRDYFSNPEFYRDVIINNAQIDVFHSTVGRIVSKYASHPSTDPFLVSVMMSFSPDNSRLDDTYDAIERAVTSFSKRYRVERVDKTAGSPKIAEQFRKLISQSALVIVDLTENKTNVYYELGFIQASGKRCVITALEGTDPSFYPREHKILFYSSARQLVQLLRPEIETLSRQLPGLKLGNEAV